VSYFTRNAQEKPDRIDIQRSLGKSLIRPSATKKQAVVWGQGRGAQRPTCRMTRSITPMADRAGDWAKAEKTLDSVPPTQ